MKLKIISDGTKLGTKLVNEETGEPVQLVQSIEWETNFSDTIPIATIKIAMPKVDLTSMAKVSSFAYSQSSDNFEFSNDEAKKVKVVSYDEIYKIKITDENEQALAGVQQIKWKVDVKSNDTEMTIQKIKIGKW